MLFFNYFTIGYCWLFYHMLFLDILRILPYVIFYYFTIGYYWLFLVILGDFIIGYFWVFYHRLFCLFFVILILVNVG
jgi:hypothetical protein